MNMHFDDITNAIAMDSKFHSVPGSQHTHYIVKEVCRTFRGITKYFCFLSSNSKQVHHTASSCYCNHCVLFGYDWCSATDLHDAFKLYTFKHVSDPNYVVIEPSSIVDDPIQAGPLPLMLRLSM